MELKTSHFKRRKNQQTKTDGTTALVEPLSPSVTWYLPLQSPTTLLYNQRGNGKAGLAISPPVRSKAYHTVPLLTLRLTAQVLSKS